MNIKFLLITLLIVPFTAWAEGRCPPGQYPVGDERQGVGGCAPIPGGQGGAPSAPVPTGEWETRWGAIAQDTGVTSGSNVAVGTSEAKRSKKEAVSAALAECAELGGRKCKVAIEYRNQCAALAGPKSSEFRETGVGTVAFRAPKEQEARSNAIAGCQAQGRGLECQLIYSGCSMSEFKPFR